MRARRILLLLLLAMGLVSVSTPAPAVLLGRVSQITQLYYDNGNWFRIMPDGSTQAFTLSQGQSFVATGLYVRFYATTPDTGPYRFFLKAPNGTSLWITSLNDLYYPTTGATVWGGGFSETPFTPGIAISVPPTVEVRQLPQPPANPNNGAVVTGTTYMRVTGYILP
jgi:hypothetical protein